MKKKVDSDKADVLQGTLILLVLRTLDVLGPMHGYGLARRIEQISGELLQLNQGTLYPALLRMEQEKWISSKWGAWRRTGRQSSTRSRRPGDDAARQDHRRLAAHVHHHRALPRLDRGSRAGGRLVSWRSVAGSRLRALFRRDRLERELDDEVRFHLEMQADDNVRAGIDPDEARRAAMRSFGGRDVMKETYGARRTIHLWRR